VAERTVDIRDPSRRPNAGEVSASREEIQRWLDGTSPLEVHDRGMTYGRVAEAIKAVADALPDIGVALNDAWRSEAAAKTQRALQMLHASGTELADAMTKMSEALTLYGRDYLPTAIEEVRAASNQRSDAEPQPSPGPSPTASASPEPTTPPMLGPQTTNGWDQPTPGATPQASQLDDEAARRAMEKLDRHIVDLYDFKIPESVTIDLPTVTPVTDDGGRDMPVIDQGTPHDFRDSRSSGGSTGGSSGWGGSSGSTGSSGSSGSNGSSGSDGSPGSGSGPGTGSGTGPGDRPGAETPGGDGPGSSDTPGSPDNPGSSGPPADQGSPAPGNQSDGTDGTTPSVIDSSTTDPERATQTGTETQDPRATETASTPPAPTTPTPTHTPVTTPQTTYVTPTGSAAPAVIGGSGPYTQPGVPGAAAAVRAGAGGMGYPFMPMGGGAPAGEQEQQEQGTNLKGERDDWHSATESTISPVIRN
jgi:hypothetical protein